MATLEFTDKLLNFATKDRVIAIFVGVAVAFGASWAYSGQFDNHGSVLGVIAIVGLGSLLVGATVGFLFGVPRFLPGGQDGGQGDGAGHGQFSPNTNLEQVSDWLTKILVGVGLTQFRSIGDALGRMLTALKPAFGDANTSTAFAGGLITYCTLLGFIGGYVYTAVFLKRILSDRFEQLVRETTREVLGETEQPPQATNKR